MSLNKVLLIGNVGKDPDVRYFDNGQAVASFPLATDWHNIVVRRDQVAFVEKWVRKGSGLYVEGKIRTRSYDDPNGMKRYVTEIHADRVEFYNTGSRPADAGVNTVTASQQTSMPQAGVSSAQTYAQPASPQQPVVASEGAPEDDLPF